MESNPFVKYSEGYVMTTALSVIILTYKIGNVYICVRKDYEMFAKSVIYRERDKKWMEIVMREFGCRNFELYSSIDDCLAPFKKKYT
jgi:hypothetical protein